MVISGEMVRCALCPDMITLADLAPGRLTAEHLTPRRHGGAGDAGNLAPAHARCNYGWRRN